MSFADKLAVGKIGESLIADWFKGRGYSILPVYEKEISEGKGPTIFCPDGSQLISPDMLVFNAAKQKVFWVEAKHKSAFTWHRISQRFVTGIDIRHFDHYLEVAATSPWEIWLLFLHRSGIAKDTPAGLVSPDGLFAGEIKYLHNNENHRHQNHGNSGMVYWDEKTLKRIATLEEITIGINPHKPHKA